MPIEKDTTIKEIEPTRIRCPHCGSQVLEARFINHLRSSHGVVDGKFLPLRSTRDFYSSGRERGTVQAGRPFSNRQKH